MKFVADPQLDLIRAAYKKEYNELFNIIRSTKKTPSDELTILRKREQKLQARTAKFLRDNNWYFACKRRVLFEQLERKGIFGSKPVTDKHVELDRKAMNKIPQVIHKMKACEECSQKFVWFEHRPERICRVCRAKYKVVV